MPDEPTVTQNAPVVTPEPTTPVAPPATTPDVPATEPAQPTAPPTEAPSEETPAAPDAPAAQAETVQDEEDIEYPNYQIPQYQPVDFNNLPVNDQNLIDPNALAGTINQSIAQAEERATLRAQQSYQEQRAEEKSWDRAYEKYPELKTNKELRDLVHRARLGEVADLLSKNQDASSVKLPTPGQIAERFFKHLGSAKVEGMKQANENTVIQQSAHLETAGTRSSDSSDARAKAFQNINNANKEVAVQARKDLLKSMLFGDNA